MDWLFELFLTWESKPDENNRRNPVSNEIVWKNLFITRNYLVEHNLVFDDEIIDRSRLGESREYANSGR